MPRVLAIVVAVIIGALFALGPLDLDRGFAPPPSLRGCPVHVPVASDVFNPALANCPTTPRP